MELYMVFLSMTQTQRAAEVLREGGLHAALVRPPLILGQGSCTHALRIAHGQGRRARDLLAARGLHPRFYVHDGGLWREAKP